MEREKLSLFDAISFFFVHKRWRSLVDELHHLVDQPISPPSKEKGYITKQTEKISCHDIPTVYNQPIKESSPSNWKRITKSFLNIGTVTLG